MMERSRAWELVGLRLATALALTACSTRAKVNDRRGPFLSVLEVQGAPTEAMAARARFAPEAVSLALGGLPPGAIARVREGMNEWADQALRRAVPDLLDLGEVTGDAASGDPPRLGIPEVPAFTAATNLLGSPWSAPGISVRIVPASEPAPTRCVALFAPREPVEDALARRGRGLAWALGDAALLRAAAPSRAALLAALHQAQSQPHSTIALVFSASRGTVDDAELDGLRSQAKSALEQLSTEASQRPWLEAIAAASDRWELPVELRSDEVLVVPRLGALARLRAFASEIEMAGSFVWVVKPDAELR